MQIENENSSHCISTNLIYLLFTNISWPTDANYIYWNSTHCDLLWIKVRFQHGIYHHGTKEKRGWQHYYCPWSLQQKMIENLQQTHNDSWFGRLLFYEMNTALKFISLKETFFITCCLPYRGNIQYLQRNGFFLPVRQSSTSTKKDVKGDTQALLKLLPEIITPSYFLSHIYEFEFILDEV